MSVSAALYDTPEVAKVRDISCHHSILLEERQQPYIQDNVIKRRKVLNLMSIRESPNGHPGQQWTPIPPGSSREHGI
jgi:hypothetical protein